MAPFEVVQLIGNSQHSSQMNPAKTSHGKESRQLHLHSQNALLLESQHLAHSLPVRSIGTPDRSLMNREVPVPERLSESLDKARRRFRLFRTGRVVF